MKIRIVVIAMAMALALAACGSSAKSSPNHTTVTAPTTVHALANETVGTNNGLNAVVCPSTTNCWAVGTNTTQKTLIDHFNGTSWVSVSSPNAADTTADPTNSNNLEAVTCVTASDCWSVGESVDTNIGTSAMFLHYNGTAWSLVTNPTPTSTDEHLHDVYCVTTSDCWAVGHSADNDLVDHWNGSSWSVVSAPNSAADDAKNTELGGVWCVSTNDCWSVGTSQTNGSETALSRAVILHWDGSSWTVADEGTGGTANSYGLNAVTCVDSNDCFAVGVNNTSRGGIVDSWNGGTWGVDEIPQPALAGQANLQAISCPAVDNCWTVGTYGATVNGQAALAQHFDGTTWTAVSTASPDTYDNLVSIDCTDPANCWAAGIATQGLNSTTLIEHAALVVPQSLRTPTARLDSISGLPAVSVGDASIVESDQNPGIRTMQFSVDLNTPATGKATVQYTLVPGTAFGTPTFNIVKTPDRKLPVAAHGDFNDLKGVTKTLTFPANLTTNLTTVQVNVGVQVYGDLITEPNETFTLVLSNPSANIQLGRSIGTGTIIDND